MHWVGQGLFVWSLHLPSVSFRLEWGEIGDSIGGNVGVKGCLCMLSLWYVGDQSSVCSAFRPVSAGIGFTSPWPSKYKAPFPMVKKPNWCQFFACNEFLCSRHRVLSATAPIGNLSHVDGCDNHLFFLQSGGWRCIFSSGTLILV